MTWVEVEHDGRRYRVAVVREPGGVWVGWPGGSAFIAAQSTSARRAEADHDVRAPMTGKVVQVRVREGERVEEGALLVVLEAMKMEYRVIAPRSDVVTKVLCRQGELIELGAPLVALGG